MPPDNKRVMKSASDHTLYRQYASNLARWLSPDPACTETPPLLRHSITTHL